MDKNTFVLEVSTYKSTDNKIKGVEVLHPASGWRRSISNRGNFEMCFQPAVMSIVRKLIDENIVEDFGTQLVQKKFNPQINDKVKALNVYEVTIKGKDGDIFICKHRDVDGISEYRGYKLHQLSRLKSQEEEVFERMTLDLAWDLEATHPKRGCIDPQHEQAKQLISMGWKRDGYFDGVVRGKDNKNET